MGLFGKIFGATPEKPPSAPSAPPPPKRRLLGGGAVPDEYGKLLTDAIILSPPFPKSMRLRAGATDYDLYGSWQSVTWNSAEEFPAVKDQVIHAYYKQFGIYRLPGGAETIRWNEMTWRAVKEQLQILYEP